MRTHKEIKAEYKLQKFKMGVFGIKNTSNGKVFIGSSLDLEASQNSQKFQLNAGLHPNAGLQKEWLEFGESSFKYEIIVELKEADTEMVNPRKEVKTLECMVIEEIKPFGEKGYHKP
jgi:hypothetical protein